MNRLATSLLALGLATVVGTASAQSSGYDPQESYPSPADGDRYGDADGVQYDYARVVRVDPVIISGDQGSDYGNGGYRSDGYRSDGYRSDGDPTSQQRCYSRQDGYYAGDDSYDNYGDPDGRTDVYRTNDDDRDDRAGSNAGRNVATVIGGVVGAVLGSKVGGGSARYATAAVGSMVGGMAGRQVYENNNRYREPREGNVTVCDPLPPDGEGYTVDDTRVAAYDVTYEYAGRRYTTRTGYHPGDTIRVRVDVRPE